MKQMHTGNYINKNGQLCVFPDSPDGKIISLPVKLIPGITNNSKINLVYDERIQ